MGPSRPAQIDNWIRDGGIVIAASERAARVIKMAYHHRRRVEGSKAWPAPHIQAWANFVVAAWDIYARDERMRLNSVQEQALWADIIGREQRVVTAFEAPRQRLASMAMRAHELLCSFAPRYLKESARIGWDNDPGVFSDWLTVFDKKCQEAALISEARLPLELTSLLQQDSTPRAPLLVVGFDRLLPMHKALFDAWGRWQEPAPDERASDIHFYAAPDEESEIEACASWCMNQIAANPNARLLVLSQDIADRRGEIERAFLRCAKPGSPSVFEFSLGIPLDHVPLVRAAYLLLRWLDSPLTEAELDWLFATDFLAGQGQSNGLQARMRAIRRRNLAQPEWTLQAFASQRIAADGHSLDWLRGLIEVHRVLKDRRQSPVDWAAQIPNLLRRAGLPGERVSSSAEFQAWQRWEQALDLGASLGFDGSVMSWREFLLSLARILEATLFAPESSDAPIQITGPAESAGLDADAVWFLGVDEEVWPPSGTSDRFLPQYLQRESRMPHTSARHDWDLAESITKRLLESAPVVNFSYASQRADSETRPSRLVGRFAVSPQPPLPPKLITPRTETQLSASFTDVTRVPFSPGKVRGGSAILTFQSQCAFKAFATARLDAQGWEPAEYGLSASQRGLLLHAVLHAVWAGPPNGLCSLDDLLALPDLRSFVEEHVRAVLREKLPDGAADRMPRRYLDLEATRLRRIVSEWLAYESTRVHFTVSETESERKIQIAGIELDLRIDRIDRLKDGSTLVIDYKTGNVTPKAWELPRPDDVQLPVYAGFALNQPIGGVVYAKVRAGDLEFAGHVKDANSTLFFDPKGTAALARNPLTAEQLDEWKSYIERLARDFVAGRADVDPREYPGTCDRCNLHTLCRIHENSSPTESEDEGSVPADE